MRRGQSTQQAKRWQESRLASIGVRGGGRADSNSPSPSGIAVSCYSFQLFIIIFRATVQKVFIIMFRVVFARGHSRKAKPVYTQYLSLVRTISHHGLWWLDMSWPACLYSTSENKIFAWVNEIHLLGPKTRRRAGTVAPKRPGMPPTPTLLVQDKKVGPVMCRKICHCLDGGSRYNSDLEEWEKNWILRHACKFTRNDPASTKKNIALTCIPAFSDWERLINFIEQKKPATS